MPRFPLCSRFQLHCVSAAPPPPCQAPIRIVPAYAFHAPVRPAPVAHHHTLSARARRDDHREHARTLRHRQRATTAAGFPGVHRCRWPARSATTMSRPTPVLRMTPAPSQGSNLTLCAEPPGRSRASSRAFSLRRPQCAYWQSSGPPFESASAASAFAAWFAEKEGVDEEDVGLTNAAGVDSLTHPPVHSRRPRTTASRRIPRAPQRATTRHDSGATRAREHPIGVPHLVDAKSYRIGFGLPRADGMCAVRACATRRGTLSVRLFFVFVDEHRIVSHPALLWF
ncbi:hypothetical protein DFH09DRAFT_1341837 [Mycena vulgaris]|nr:hypothetical protein DFH09DRAFT_1341837 [Mycena vulgaris]